MKHATIELNCLILATTILLMLAPSTQGSGCEPKSRYATVCAGDLNGSLDDRLQSLAYQVVSVDYRDDTAQVLLSTGLILNVAMESGWFEVMSQGEPVIEGQLVAFGDSEAKSVTVDFYAPVEVSASSFLHALVTAGTQPGEVILQMTTTDQVVDTSIMVSEMHTAFAHRNAAAAQRDQREALVAPQLLHGMVHKSNMLSGEAIMLAVLAAMNDVVIPQKAEADTRMTTLHERLNRLGFGGQSIMGDGTVSDCLDDCNDVWDPIIQQAIDERANAYAEASEIRDSATEAYIAARTNSVNAMNGCMDDVRAGFIRGAGWTIACGLGVDAALVVAAASSSAASGGISTPAAVTFLGAKLGQSGTLCLLAVESEEESDSCLDQHQQRVKVAREVRDAQFATADALESVAEANQGDAVQNLQDCAEACES